MEDTRTEIQKEMDNFNLDNIEPFTSLDSFEMAMICRPYGGESTEKIELSSPYSGRHPGSSLQSSDDSCVIVCDANLRTPPADPSSKAKSPPKINTNKISHTHTHTQPDPLSLYDPSSKAKSPPNAIDKSNKTTVPISTHPHTLTQTQPHTHTAPLSSPLPMGTEIGAKQCTQAHSQTHTHYTPLSSSLTTGPEIGANIEIQATKTLASALPKKTTSPTADREPPVGSNTAINKNNKRLLSSSPTTLTNDIKRANREFEHVAPKLDQLAHPNNNTTKNNKSPIKILSDELLRNFFSQLKDSDANPPPPNAPKTTYSQILQQEPEYSSPTRPAKLATMNQSSKPAPKKPTPLRASESSSADMGPVVFNVKATVHTTPNHNPQGPALMDVSSPFHYKPEKTPVFKSLYAQRLYMERVEARAEANRVKGNGAREGAQINGNSSNKNNNIKTPTAMAPPIVPLRKPPVPLMSLSLPFRPPTNALALAQCHRCQKHGHKKGSCRRAFVCMKCAGQHPTTACKKPRHVPPRCCNCGGRHISAYKGCRVFQEVKRRAAQDTLRPVAPPERQRSHRPLKKDVGPSQNRNEPSNNNYWTILQNDEMTPTPHHPIKQRPNKDPRHHSTRQLQKSPHHRSRMAQTNPDRRLNQQRQHPTEQRSNYNPFRQQRRPNPAEAHLARFQERLQLEQEGKERSQRLRGQGWPTPQESLIQKRTGAALKNSRQSSVKSQLHWHKLLEKLAFTHEAAQSKLLEKVASIEKKINKLSTLFIKITNMFDITEASPDNDFLANLSCSIQTIEMASILNNSLDANDCPYA